MREIHSSADLIGRPAWLPDGRALIVPVRLPEQQRFQLWSIAFPSGKAQRFTNDLSDYANVVDITRDGKMLGTAATSISADLWFAPDGQPAKARPVTQGGLPLPLVAPLPDGRAVAASITGEACQTASPCCLTVGVK